MTTRPIKVLHAVGAMNRAGSETWLMHILRRLDPTRFQFTFLKFSDHPSAYDEELLSLGGKIVTCLHAQRPHHFAPDLLALLKRERFDIVHSHVHWYSGIMTSVAAMAGIPNRFVHSHNDTRQVDLAASAIRQAYVKTMRFLIRTSMTHGIAVSNSAGTCMFGEAFNRTGRARVLHCGIDLAPFSDYSQHSSLRAALGISRDLRVIGHVARFDPQKNHAFLIDAVAPLLGTDPRIRLMLVGAGNLRTQVENRAIALGVRDKVMFLGEREDVPALLTNVFDILVLPSLHEGLPLAVMEAQAAGLPTLISEATPDEATIVPQLVQRLPINRGPTVWTEAISRTIGQLDVPACSREFALDAVARSTFNIECSARALLNQYEDAMVIAESRKHFPEHGRE